MASSDVEVKINPRIEKMLRDAFSEDMGIKIGLVGKPQSGSGSSSGGDSKKTRDKDGNIIYDDSVDLAYIASIHEWGYEDENISIPQRSFLRSTYEENEKKIEKNLAIAIKKQTNNNIFNGEEALKELGVWVVGRVKDKFTNNDWPALKDPTRGGRNKEGTATPLVDTLQLRASIDYELVKVK